MSGLGRAFAFFTGSSFISTITQVVKGKLTAVLLGTAGVGTINQLTSVWSLFSVVAGMGFYNGMVRHMAERWGCGEREGFHAHMSSSAFFLLMTSLIVTFAGCIFSEQISEFVFDDNGQRAGLICLILASIPVFSIAQVYRAMLNATRSVSFMVRARIAADVSSVVVLAVLIYPLGLKGAILGYIALHILFLGFSVIYTRQALGSDMLLPKFSNFRWSEIHCNIGYGINGLFAVMVGILTTIIISRWIISSVDTGANGIFTMALKVATVYLGGLSAAAGGYYFPTLAAAKTDSEMHAHVDETLAHYLYLIPPIIVVLMAGGDIMMQMLFSAEFIPAAMLLLLILPGDLFRITAETVGLPLVVKKKLAISTGLYVIWAAVYLVLSAWLLPVHGVLGVAAAYLISQIINAGMLLIVVRLVLQYRMAKLCQLTIIRGFLLVAGSAVFLWVSHDGLMEYIFCSGLLAMWAVFSFRDPAFVRITKRLVAKFR